MAIPEVKALTFDVFGTVVNWRDSVAREAKATLGPKGSLLRLCEAICESAVSVRDNVRLAFAGAIAR